MDSYDKAYNSWDEMTPSERKSWCERNEENCTDEEANHTANWLSENRYCFWTTIRELLNYE